MKKMISVLLAASMVISMSACGGGNKTVESASAAKIETTATETTVAATKEAETIAAPTVEAADDDNAIVMWYGGNYYQDKVTYATFSLPEGAYFDESDYEDYLEDGYVYSFTVYDDEREYTVNAEDYKGREVYNEDLIGYSLLQQLYFDGKAEEATAEEYESFSQSVTDLGFQWEGKDVILIETRSTLVGYWEQTDMFVGVEYEFPYWKAKENGGVEDNLIARGLVGFHIFSNGIEELTADQCAWVAGQLFGVDSKRTWPLDSESSEAPKVADVGAEQIYGTWLERDSDWDNTYTFYEDGTGLLVSGPEYPFTYEVDGDKITLTYDDGDEETFTVTAEDDLLTFVDQFSNELLLDRQKEEKTVETEAEPEETEAAADENPLLGTWADKETEYKETFTFYEDGTGVYSYDYEGKQTYNFTYSFFRSDYVEIFYDDGTTGEFLFVIDGDTMRISNDSVYEMPFERQ